jgi:hypothetical protein
LELEVAEIVKILIKGNIKEENRRRILKTSRSNKEKPEFDEAFDEWKMNRFKKIRSKIKYCSKFNDDEKNAMQNDESKFDERSNFNEVRNVGKKLIWKLTLKNQKRKLNQAF